MKRLLLFSVFILLIFSCSKNQDLTFQNSEMSIDDCDNCPLIKVDIPEAEENSDIAIKINTILAEKVIEIIDFSEEKELENIPEAIQSFSSSYKELVKEFPESVKWEATVDGSISSRHKEIICIQLNSYMFTGGAHGYNAVTYINFNLKSGNELSPSDFVKDIDKFTLMAEKMFRKQEDIPLDKNINSTGFMFENDQFHLPENIGFTENEIILFYNQYEIASYADGPKTIEIPLSQAKELLINL
ncbi:DUF4163 domain-containing protein [Flavobacteriaceae bacterium R38]|nr:DUF4163 domain-containing protein [Flavobacteriaceae bacterium R38]